AAIALAGIEDAELASCAAAEVERVFDDPAERACLERERVAPLIAPRDGGAVARRGMVVLVIGQRFAGSEVALGGAARITVDRADPVLDLTQPVEADVLDQEVADDFDRGDRHRGLTGRVRGGAEYQSGNTPQERRPPTDTSRRHS